MEQGLRGISSVQAYGLESKVGDDYERALGPESAGKVKQGIIAGSVFGFSQMAGEIIGSINVLVVSVAASHATLMPPVFVSFAIVFAVGSSLLVSGKINFVSFFTSVLAVMFGALGRSGCRLQCLLCNHTSSNTCVSYLRGEPGQRGF